MKRGSRGCLQTRTHQFQLIEGSEATVCCANDNAFGLCAEFCKQNIAEFRIQKRGAVEGCGRTMFAPTTYLTDTANLKRGFGGIAQNRMGNRGF